MIQALQLILSLSFLVVIHELGHFAFARLFKVRVEKFYMFFNPYYSLVRLKRFGGKWHVRFFSPNVPAAAVEKTDEATGAVCKDEKGNILYRPMTPSELEALPEDDWRRYPDSTEWGIGWVPFGGYCAIAGMVDETKAATDLPQEPQSWEFRSKNVWQRLGIISGGILVNFIAAMLIFGQLLFWWGEDYLPLHNVKDGLYYSQLLEDEGFRQKDRILTIDAQEPDNLSDIIQKLIIEGKRNVQVLRGNDTLSLTMSADLGNRYLALQNEFDRREREKARHNSTYQKARFVLINYYFPFVIDSVVPETAAYYASLQAGDRILHINDEADGCYWQISQSLLQNPCDSVQVTFVRQTDTLTTHAFIGDNGQLGCFVRGGDTFFTYEHRDYSLWASIPKGISNGWQTLVAYVKQFRLVFSPEGVQSLGGFGAMGSMFSTEWNGYAFWAMTAFLSLILAFMNFLPIPALDGGYILFLLVEILTGKKPSDKFLERANTVGFALLIALLILANGNDILRYFF